MNRVIKFLGGVKSVMAHPILSAGYGVKRIGWNLKYLINDKKDYIDFDEIKEENIDKINENIEEVDENIKEVSEKESKKTNSTISLDLPFYGYVDKILENYTLTEEEMLKICDIQMKIIESKLEKDAIDFIKQNNIVVKNNDDFDFLLDGLELIIDNKKLEDDFSKSENKEEFVEQERNLSDDQKKFFDEINEKFSNIKNLDKVISDESLAKEIVEVDKKYEEIYDDNVWFKNVKRDLEKLYKEVSDMAKEKENVNIDSDVKNQEIVSDLIEEENDNNVVIIDDNISKNEEKIFAPKLVEAKQEEKTASDIYEKREEIVSKLALLQKKLNKKQKKFDKVSEKIKGSSESLEYAIGYCTNVELLSKFSKHAASIKELKSYIDVLTKKLSYVEKAIDKKNKEIEEERIAEEYFREIEEQKRKQEEYEKEYLQMVKEQEDAEYVKYWENADINSMSELNRLTDSELKTYIKLEKKMGLR